MSYDNCDTHRLHPADIRLAGEPSDALIREFELDVAHRIWRESADGRAVPAWSDIDLLKFPMHLHRGTMVADYHPDRNDYFIRYWGVDLAQVFGVELTQKWLSKTDHNGFMDSFAETARDCLETRAPQWLSQEITSPNGLRRIFPVVRLPLVCPDTGRQHVMTVENIGKSARFFAENMI